MCTCTHAASNRRRGKQCSCTQVKHSCAATSRSLSSPSRHRGQASEHWHAEPVCVTAHLSCLLSEAKQYGLEEGPAAGVEELLVPCRGPCCLRHAAGCPSACLR